MTNVLKKVLFNKEFISCFCGCGELFERFDNRGRERRFKKYHNLKGKYNPFFGKTHTLENRIKLKISHTGENNLQWKGIQVNYQSLHIFIRRNFPPPLKCEDCNIKNVEELANITGMYNRDINNWKYLCRKCHKARDKNKNYCVIK